MESFRYRQCTRASTIGQNLSWRRELLIVVFNNIAGILYCMALVPTQAAGSLSKREIREKAAHTTRPADCNENTLSAAAGQLCYLSARCAPREGAVCVFAAIKGGTGLENVLSSGPALILCQKSPCNVWSLDKL